MAKELSTITLTDDLLRQIEQAAAAVERTESQLALVSATVEFVAAADIELVVGDQRVSLPAGQSWSTVANTATEVEIPGVVTARVTPGASALEIQAQYAAAQEKLAAALAAAQVADLAAARQADQRRRELQGTRDQLTATLAGLSGDEDIEQLRSRLAELQRCQRFPTSGRRRRRARRTPRGGRGPRPGRRRLRNPPQGRGVGDEEAHRNIRAGNACAATSWSPSGPSSSPSPTGWPNSGPPCPTRSWPQPSTPTRRRRTPPPAASPNCRSSWPPRHPRPSPRSWPMPSSRLRRCAAARRRCAHPARDRRAAHGIRHRGPQRQARRRRDRPRARPQRARPGRPPGPRGADAARGDDASPRHHPAALRRAVPRRTAAARPSGLRPELRGRGRQRPVHPQPHVDGSDRPVRIAVGWGQGATRHPGAAGRRGAGRQGGRRPDPDRRRARLHRSRTGWSRWPRCSTPWASVDR